MKKLRIVIETDVSSWTPEQIVEYQRLLGRLLLTRIGNVDMVGDKQTWIFEKDGEEVEIKP